jgi:hypothetical protein
MESFDPCLCSGLLYCAERRLPWGLAIGTVADDRADALRGKVRDFGRIKLPGHGQVIGKFVKIHVRSPSLPGLAAP